MSTGTASWRNSPCNRWDSPMRLRCSSSSRATRLGWCTDVPSCSRGSFGLWGVVQLNKILALTAYAGPHQVWYFNPFSWQALFFLGAWCGWRGIKGGIPWLTNHWLFRLALAGALAAFLIRFSWTLHWL